MSRSAGMVDGADSKSAEGNLMGVRVPPSAPQNSIRCFFITSVGLSALCRQVPLANPHEHGAGTRLRLPVCGVGFPRLRVPPSAPQNSIRCFFITSVGLSALCRQVPLANPHEHGAGTRLRLPVCGVGFPRLRVPPLRHQNTNNRKVVFL